MDNQGPGIHVSGSDSDSCIIEHNTIIQNGRQEYDDAGITLRQYNENANIIMRYNSIYDNVPYDARNDEEIDINISNNWWGTTDTELIDSNIHDYYDDFTRGKLNYTPFLTRPDPDAPDPSEIINEPPFTPTIPEGHTSCLVNSSYTYVTTAEDPEGNQIRYGWDWDGDGTVDEWSDYMESGHMDVKQHMWTTPGTYNARVKAADEHGDESEWSEVLEVEARIVYVGSDADEDNYSIIPILFIVIVIIVLVVGIVFNIIKRKKAK